MKRPARLPLSTAETVRLDGLLRQAASLLPPAECNELIDLWARHLADGERARRTIGGLQRKVEELRRETS